MKIFKRLLVSPVIAASIAASFFCVCCGLITWGVFGNPPAGSWVEKAILYFEELCTDVSDWAAL